MKLANWMLLLALMQIYPSEIKAQEAFVADETFDTFLQRFEDAQTRFVNGDPTAWIQMAAKDESVTIFGAFGGYEQGWVEVGPRYEWAAAQYRSSGAKKSIEYLSKYVDDSIAYTVAIERDQVRITERTETEPRALRATQVFRRVDGEWRLVHRHADPLLSRHAPARE
jgi:hypothetical protein